LKLTKGLLLALLSFGLIAAALPATALTRELPPEKIFIVPGSSINLVARESSIPVSVQNNFNVDITVQVHLRSNNPRVIVPKSFVEVVVPANTTINAQIPVRAIGNGDVQLTAWLESFTGNRIGKNVEIQMSVNADIETTAIVLFLSLVGLLLLIGVVRTLRRKTASSK
jgi:hypothetical protein